MLGIYGPFFVQLLAVMQQCVDVFDDKLSWELCWGTSSKKGHLRRFNTRRLCLAVRREAFVAFSNALVVTASTLLVLTALSGLNSPDGDISEDVLVSVWNEGTQREQMSETHVQLTQQLHDSFDLPFRMLEPISYESKLDLLDHLRAPSKSIVPLPSRRVIFAHVHGQSLIERIRAFATVVTYARGTGRVPVIFWHLYRDGFRRPFSTLFDWNCLMDYQSVVVVDVSDPDFTVTREKKLVTEGLFLNQDKNFQQSDGNDIDGSGIPPSKHAGSLDWADFSVHEIQPDLGTSEFSSYPAHPLPWQSSIDDKRKEIMHKSMDVDFSSIVSALNTIASWNIHVVLTISGAIRSRYTPLTAAEEAVQTCLAAKSPQALSAVANAHMTVPQRITPDYSNVIRILHDEFQIPYLLLNGLRPVMRRILLDKLLRKKKQGQFAPRTIWVHPQYGLGNRLRALGSAMAFAKETGRVLVLIWMPDAHLNCHFRDLFVEQDDLLVSDSFDPQEQWPFVHAKSRDVAMHAVDWYNYMRVNGVHVNKPADPVFDVPTRHIYVSTAYVIQSPVTPFIIKTESLYWRILKNLTPHIDVARLVDRQASTFVTGIMGVHIRGRNIKTDISGVSVSAYSEESSRRTDYWRNLTRVESFVEEMRKQNKSQLFYLAADQKDVFNRIEKEFPGRVFYTPRRCDSRDRECLPFALADILLLAKCSSIRGSYWSSFSELSVRWGGAKFLLAGVDFGRPSNNGRASVNSGNATL